MHSASGDGKLERVLCNVERLSHRISRRLARCGATCSAPANDQRPVAKVAAISIGTGLAPPPASPHCQIWAATASATSAPLQGLAAPTTFPFLHNHTAPVSVDSRPFASLVEIHASSSPSRKCQIIPFYVSAGQTSCLVDSSQQNNTLQACLPSNLDPKSPPLWKISSLPRLPWYRLLQARTVKNRTSTVIHENSSHFRLHRSCTLHQNLSLTVAELSSTSHLFPNGTWRLPWARCHLQLPFARSCYWRRTLHRPRHARVSSHRFTSQIQTVVVC